MGITLAYYENMDAAPVETAGHGSHGAESGIFGYTEMKETIQEGKRWLEEHGEAATINEVIDVLHDARSKPVKKEDDWMERFVQKSGTEVLFGNFLPRLMQAVGVSRAGIERYLDEYVSGQGRNVRELAEGARRILWK